MLLQAHLQLVLLLLLLQLPRLRSRTFRAVERPRDKAKEFDRQDVKEQGGRPKKML